MEPYHAFISWGNQKLGPSIPSINLPVGKTCRPDAPCAKKCYAKRGRLSFKRNKELYEANLALWAADPDGFKRDVICGAAKSRFFRWHTTGDIPDIEYLHMMVRVAKELPYTNFLAFTKKWELVDSYINAGGNLSPNLTIVYSVWGDFAPENPYNSPLAMIRFKHDLGITVNEQASFICPRYCGDCVMQERNCWNLKHGQIVCFDEH